MRKIYFLLLILISQFSFSQSEKKTLSIPNPSEIIYSTDQVKVAPKFNGGKKALELFIKRNFVKPNVKGLKGEVLVAFVVEKDGTLTEIGVLSDAGNGTADEAIRVMSISPVWSPGILNGIPVRVQYMITIPVVTD
ncbi:energy transducer TonB [Flavobacterium sp.]|uniref:energy transducer TonB n=1 Tax=Flavobacterium sp. TaxID=239 RepID=UPI0037526AF6